MREEKKLLLKEIKDKIDGSKAFFITRYRNVDPNKASDFRINLSKIGGEFEVVRKRILIKAMGEAGIKLDESMLEGHIGVVFAKDDPIETTKAIFTFRKENEELLDVTGGRFDGQLCSAKDIETISELPSKEEMRAQLLSVFEAPLSQSLAVMDALLTSVVHCLENKSSEQQQV